VICTDCYSNLVIFSEFKQICKNSDELLRKYQVNKVESTDVESSSHAASTKGNGKCKSIRNSEEMANRIKECAFKKSVTFIENMKNFYFLLNQIEDLETNGGAQVIIKNEIASESLIPAVEINIKNEIIYPSEENQVLMGSVIQQASSAHQHHLLPETSGTESKRKRRKSNKRKFVNGQTMEIDETGNIVARQILVATSDQGMQQQQQQHHQNLQITTTQNENNEMALMLTVKPVDSQDQQPQTITVSHSQIQPIQIHSSE
jgi:predicted DNA-binding protein